MPYTKDFLRLGKSVKKQYLGKSVPNKYQKRYGKRYGFSDVKSLSYAIAKSRGIKIDKTKIT